MGLNLILGDVASQYSRASMFTLRWSMPSWQMSACERRGRGAAAVRKGATRRPKQLCGAVHAAPGGPGRARGASCRRHGFPQFGLAR